MSTYTVRFSETSIADVAITGGKNASVGEMIRTLSGKGINVPDGFAVTAQAFRYFLEYNNLGGPLKEKLKSLDRVNFTNLAETSAEARKLMMKGHFPEDLVKEILSAYRLPGSIGAGAVAVRSSATAEDLPGASFAGLHESFLNVTGEKELLEAVKKCFSSLFTARAIKYREDRGFDHFSIALSVGVQKMVRSDLACSGIGFTLEPESGFRDIIHLSGTWGLGENIVQGSVNPDEFLIFKPTLLMGKNPIVQRKLGKKEKTMVYGPDNTGVVNLDTSETKRNQFVLSDKEIVQLAQWAGIIENHYGMPMDIEWAKDGITGELYIIQARPETAHGTKEAVELLEYTIITKGKTIAQGEAIGSKLAIGMPRVLQSPDQGDELQPGEILIAEMTSPDWDPILKKAAAIVTNKGGRTSHASIVARELGVPAIVGTGNATEVINSGKPVTVACCEGKTGHVYEGESKYELTAVNRENIEMPESVDVMLITGDPDKAFRTSFYPNNGVGLMRMEFIISHMIQVHPLALCRFEEIKDEATRSRIIKLTEGYTDRRKYFVDKLAEGIATITAAFYPKDVIVRMSDFKTNEYANLIGGKVFEPLEENPMLGFRGASRYYNDLYRDAFQLECDAVKKVRNEMGLDNLKIMIPFCRTVEEAGKVVRLMAGFGLDRTVDPTLEIYMMMEIPSNVLLAEEFADIFDGFSIGSNDLTQLTLGVDRDSPLVQASFNEQNKAVMMMISMAIAKARAKGTRIGLCGQAPSDYPEFAAFLTREGIDSISFNTDAVVKGIQNIVQAELTILSTRDDSHQ